MAIHYEVPVHRVIARYTDGTVLKGHTRDFLPAKDRFHLLPVDSSPGTGPTEVLITELKGVFFVHHLEGDPAHTKRNTFESTDMTPGRRVRVVFNDGEVLLGVTLGRRGRTGFFVMPADQRSNNERCFVVTAATREIALL
jgi:hypothetical protein